MALNIYKNKDQKEIAEYIYSSINKQLTLGKKVLWFICGGSSIDIEVLIANKLKDIPKDRLTITLTDERYGDIDHIDSNLSQLYKKGFHIDGAKIIPFLNGKDIESTTKDIIKILKKEIDISDYKIGLFGVGVDGHTAGILPYSKALYSNDLISYYNTPLYKRITITEKVIEKLDEGFVYALGELKIPVIEELKENNISTEVQPSQILKKIPILTIFTD